MCSDTSASDSRPRRTISSTALMRTPIRLQSMHHGETCMCPLVLRWFMSGAGISARWHPLHAYSGISSAPTYWSHPIRGLTFIAPRRISDIVLILVEIFSGSLKHRRAHAGLPSLCRSPLGENGTDTTYPANPLGCNPDRRPKSQRTNPKSGRGPTFRTKRTFAGSADLPSGGVQFDRGFVKSCSMDLSGTGPGPKIDKV